MNYHKEAVAWRGSDKSFHRFAEVDPEADAEHIKSVLKALELEDTRGDDDDGGGGPDGAAEPPEPPAPPPALEPPDPEWPALEEPPSPPRSPPVDPVAEKEFWDEIDDTLRATEVAIVKNLTFRPSKPIQVTWHFFGRGDEKDSFTLGPFMLGHKYYFGVWYTPIVIDGEGPMATCTVPFPPRPLRHRKIADAALRAKWRERTPVEFTFERFIVTVYTVRWLSFARGIVLDQEPPRSFRQRQKKKKQERRPRKRRRKDGPPAIRGPPEVGVHAHVDGSESDGSTASAELEVGEKFDIDAMLFEAFGLDADGDVQEEDLGIEPESEGEGVKVAEPVFRDEYGHDGPGDVIVDDDDDSIIRPPVAGPRTVTEFQIEERVLDGVFRAVQEQRTHSYDLHREAEAQATRSIALPRRQHTLSLVRCRRGGDIVNIIVRWESPVVWTARPVRVDEKWRLVSRFLPPESFAGAEVLIGDIGMPLLKGPKGQRDHLADWVVSYMTAANLELFAGPLLVEMGCDCIACQQAMLQPGFVRPPDDAVIVTASDDLYGCYRCGLRWHLQCNVVVARNMGYPSPGPVEYDSADTRCIRFQCFVCKALAG